jgi:hypothetical protein
MKWAYPMNYTQMMPRNSWKVNLNRSVENMELKQPIVNRIARGKIGQSQASESSKDMCIER